MAESDTVASRKPKGAKGGAGPARLCKDSWGLQAQEPGQRGPGHIYAPFAPGAARPHEHKKDPAPDEKYGPKRPARKASPHRRIAKALKADTTFPDILDREFEGRGPRAVLLTGITYIINGKTPRCHMCAIIGGRAKELPAWRPVGSLEIDFVL